MLGGSNFDNFSQKALNYLNFSEIPQEIIQQAYQDALPPDAGVWNSEGNDLKKIIQELGEFRRLFEFLTSLSQDENIPEKNRNKLSDFAKQIASKQHPEEKKKKPATDFFYNEQGRIESYLIATLERFEDTEQFLFNAWLIIDDSLPVNDLSNLSKFKSLLDKDEQQQGTLYNFNDIPNQLNEFLKKSLEHLRNKDYYLIIEVFLPIDLIFTEVDNWKIFDPIDDQQKLGSKYPIRLRSLERLDIKYLDTYLPDWRERWNQVKPVLHKEVSQELFEHVEEMENLNWKLLTISLREKIGLKVTCAPPQTKRKDLLRAILKATTPIAIWTRCDIPNFEQVAAIDEILALNPLCHLSESVKRTREKAHAQTEEHLGLHLALLWEDPHRLTPAAMINLKTPGE